MAAGTLKSCLCKGRGGFWVGEGRKSLVGMFALCVVLTFFVESPKDLSWGGIKLPEKNIWICLLIAQIYFCIMAYTKGTFSGIKRGKETWLAYIRNGPPARIDQIMRTYVATTFAILTFGLIIWGLVSLPAPIEKGSFLGTFA